MKDTPLDIHECIEYLMREKGLTVYALSKELGFDKPAKLYTILNRRTKPSFDTLVSITNRFDDLNGNWLLRGTGNPYMEPDEQTKSRQIDRLSEHNQQLEKQVADRNETIELLRQQILILREMISYANRPASARADEKRNGVLNN